MQGAVNVRQPYSDQTSAKALNNLPSGWNELIPPVSALAQRALARNNVATLVGSVTTRANVASLVGSVPKLEDCKEDNSVLSLFEASPTHLSYPKQNKRGLMQVFMTPFVTCEQAGSLSEDDGDDGEILFFSDSNPSSLDDASQSRVGFEEDLVREEMEIIKRMSAVQTQNSETPLAPYNQPDSVSFHSSPYDTREMPSGLCRSTSSKNNTIVGTRKKRLSVAFHDPPVSSLRQYPAVCKEDIPSLFFSEEELRLAEDDRRDGHQYDDVECVHMSADQWKDTLHKKKLSNFPEKRHPAQQNEQSPKTVMDRIMSQRDETRTLWSASPILRRNNNPKPRRNLSPPPSPLVVDERTNKEKSIRSRLRRLVGRPPRNTQSAQTQSLSKKSREAARQQAKSEDEESKTVVFLRSRTKAEKLSDE